MVPIPQIGVNGAAIASVACHLVAFTIAITSLRRTIKLDLNFSKFVVKPIIAAFIMAVCSYSLYLTLSKMISQKLATIIAIVVAAIVYVLAIFVLKLFSKDEFQSLPFGNKIYKILKKLKIY